MDALELSFEETAYLAYILWAYPIEPSDLRLESITLPSNVDILDNPTEWGVSQEDLRRRLHNLTDDQQAEVRSRFDKLSEFELIDRNTISDILHKWISKRKDSDSRAYLQRMFAAAGLDGPFDLSIAKT